MTDKEKEFFIRRLNELIELVRSSESCPKISLPDIETFYIEDAIKYMKRKSEIDTKINFIKNDIVKDIEKIIQKGNLK